jgi:hypothetical protein
LLVLNQTHPRACHSERSEEPPAFALPLPLLAFAFALLSPFGLLLKKTDGLLCQSPFFIILRF